MTQFIPRVISCMLTPFGGQLHSGHHITYGSSDPWLQVWVFAPVVSSEDSRGLTASNWDMYSDWSNSHGPVDSGWAWDRVMGLPWERD